MSTSRDMEVFPHCENIFSRVVKVYFRVVRIYYQSVKNYFHDMKIVFPSALLDSQLGKTEHEDFRSGIVKLDRCLGIKACALNGLHHATAETLVKDDRADA